MSNLNQFIIEGVVSDIGFSDKHLMVYVDFGNNSFPVSIPLEMKDKIKEGDKLRIIGHFKSNGLRADHIDILRAENE